MRTALGFSGVHPAGTSMQDRAPLGPNARLHGMTSESTLNTSASPLSSAAPIHIASIGNRMKHM